MEDIEEVVNDFKKVHNMKEIDFNNKDKLKLLVKTIKEKTNATIREISEKLRYFEICCI